MRDEIRKLSGQEALGNGSNGLKRLKRGTAFWDKPGKKELGVKNIRGRGRKK